MQTLAEHADHAAKVAEDFSVSKRSFLDLLSGNEHLAALEAAGLRDNLNPLIYQLRLQFASDLGFVRIKPSEAVRMLDGRRPVRTDFSPGRHVLPWQIEDAEGKEGTDWGFEPSVFICEDIMIENVRRRWPLGHREVRSVRNRKTYTLGSPERLSVPIPMGVALLMSELRAAKVFNCFKVVAPSELFDSFPATMQDPVLLGEVARIVRGARGALATQDPRSHFVALWK